MSERNAPSRAISVGGGVIAIAGLAVALTLHARAFTEIDWVLTLAGATGIAFVARNALPVRGLRMRRSGLSAEAIFLDLPIAAPLFALGSAVGPTACALALTLGFGSASLLRKASVAEVQRHGVLRVLTALALLPLGIDAAQLQTPVFAAAAFSGVVLFTFGISAPASAYTFRLSLLRLWTRLARDPRMWGVAVGGVIWATVGRNELVLGEYILAVALWLPVCLCAFLLHTIDKQQAELHRLRLVRDAVQAMLGERNPLPQINAILATLRVPSFDETVSVFAATSARTDAWRPVTTIGPALSSAGDELRRRILARLKFSGSTSTTLRDEFYTAYAFPARLSDGEVHGAMTIHRRHDRPTLSNDQLHQFANAASELAPLLRDMRTIAATQNAAMIDGLTGLVNRATAMDRLQTMLEQISITEYGAVLLLDIDHFKSINDQLGHAAGDECLRKIGDIIRTTVRSGDTAGRIGGEEFLVVMPGASRDVALTVGERLRLSVSLGGMRHANGEPVTASIGAAAARVGDTSEMILARADRGLYEAKRQGRNRLVEDLESA